MWPASDFVKELNEVVATNKTLDVVAVGQLCLQQETEFLPVPDWDGWMKLGGRFSCLPNLQHLGVRQCGRFIGSLCYNLHHILEQLEDLKRKHFSSCVMTYKNVKHSSDSSRQMGAKNVGKVTTRTSR